MPPLVSDTHFLPNLTSPQVAGLDKTRSIVVLPLASIEQHGPHLPIYTDSLIVQEVLDRALALLPSDFPIEVLPLLPYGKSNEHGAFPGTVTLRSETLAQVLKDIGASIARSGFRRFVIFNGHGGNTEIVDFVIRDIREQTRLLVFALHLYLRLARPASGLDPTEQVYGIHAGDFETSLLLRCHPELVQRELIASTPVERAVRKHPPFMGPLTYAWLTQDISESGVIGDATTADAAKGERWLNEGAMQTAEAFRQIAEFDFAPSRAAS